MAINRRVDRAGKVVGWQVVIEKRDPVSRRRSRQVVGTFRTKKEAEREEREALVRRDGGTLVDPTRQTVGDLLDRWHETKEGTISRNAWSDYGDAIRLHLKPAIGEVKAQELRHADVQELVNSWRGKPKMGARLVHRCVSVMRQAYAQAIREHIVVANPVVGIQLPSIAARRQLSVWTPDEVAAFLESAAGDSLEPLWHLLVLEGMRRSEALGLRWADLNWQADGKVTAHIVQTVVPDRADRGQPMIVGRTKTAAGARAVLLTTETVQLLRIHRNGQKLIRLRRGDDWNPGDLIVCTSVGTPVNPANVARSQRIIMAGAGVPELTTHDLRHTAATVMLLEGVPIKMVSEKLGHASVMITLDTYGHIAPNMQEAASAAMDAALARGRAALKSMELG
ncbi:MAG: site-specific integrase [Planctomycetaceae bacterium]|nr:site-specific integrase [Planctomycetaceae bacterium]